VDINPKKKNAYGHGSLKKVVRDLIISVGGVEAAAAICGKGRSVVSDYQSESKPKTSMPIELVERLERKSGVPYVTRYLATALGFDLLPHHGRTDDKSAIDHVSGITKEFGEVLAHASTFVKCGALSPADAKALLQEIDDVREALATMRAAVAKQTNAGAVAKAQAIRGS